MVVFQFSIFNFQLELLLACHCFQSIGISIQCGEHLLADNPLGVGIPAVEAVDVLQEAEVVALMYAHLVLLQEVQLALEGTAIA